MNSKEIINSAKKRFEKELHTNEYKKIHEDSNHLNLLLNLCKAKDDDKILDLGTGNGYIAFELARRYPNVSIAGLDIAESSINKNNRIVESENLQNIKFYSYDGINLPFEDESFTKVVSRYAFHHFPEPTNMIKSIYSKLKKHGQFILSDAMTYDSDTNHFIDRFQALKKDGHRHFYKLDEIKELFTTNGFAVLKTGFNKISYPRELNKNYICLLDNTSENIKNKYEIRIDDNRIFVTVKGFNIKAGKT
jgi:cyclopropane fatty-acyl-phospholipid synthase-like methyltransferase